MRSLSIVLPVYNQERNLPAFFQAYDSYAAAQKDFLLTLVLVNDGSTDTSLALLNDFAQGRAEVQCLSYAPNKGRGYAVRAGMKATQSDWVLIMDADLAASFDEIKKLLAPMDSACSVIIGSRRVPGARIETPPSLLRFLLGWGYILSTRALTGVLVSDVSCGFKCFSRAAADCIVTRGRINRWSHDAENLYLAKKFNFTVCEIPLVWRNGSESKVRIVKDVVQSFAALLTIRFRRY